eukprot:8899522-Pyramimonas_sp.AAC.1
MLDDLPSSRGQPRPPRLFPGASEAGQSSPPSPHVQKLNVVIDVHRRRDGRKEPHKSLKTFTARNRLKVVLIELKRRTYGMHSAYRNSARTQHDRV